MRLNFWDARASWQWQTLGHWNGLGLRDSSVHITAEQCLSFASLLERMTRTIFASPPSTPVLVKNCRPLWREAHVRVKKVKRPHGRSIFRS